MNKFRNRNVINKMIKIRYVVILALILPACQIAVTPPTPSGSKNPSPLVSSSSPVNTTTPLPQDSSNLNTNNTGSPSPIPTPTAEFSPSNNGNPSASPTPDHHSNMPGPNGARCVSLVPLTQAEIDRGCVYLPPNPHPTPVYSKNYPVPEGLTEGSVSLIFKDEYKVRYDREKKEFYSLTGADVTNINSIIKNTTIIEVYGYFEMTEEQAEEMDKRLEESDGYDYVNQLSSYGLKAKDTDIKDFIEKLRQDPLVRQSNHETGSTPY